MVYNIWLLIIAALAASALLELVAGLIARGIFARLVSFLALLLTSVCLGMVLGTGINLLTVLFFALGFYRLINTSRIFARRLEPKNLRRRASRATFYLLILQAVILAADYYWPDVELKYWLGGLAVIQLIVALVFLVSFTRRFKQSHYKPVKLAMSDHQLPTLTVAIPAKDETAMLEDCLRSVLGSDYPKLEVLVLDDSAGSRTGQIINSLAHDGVRFILGDEPEGNWLAKNLAYDRLAREANGQIILFCGVDVRFGRSSLRQIVLAMLAKQQHMVSVMPLNLQQPKSRLVQPMRYFWELARPRTKAGSQPVLSSCWAISKVSLTRVGGFRSVKQAVVPERHFAARNVRSGAGYQFLRASRDFAVSSVKPGPNQRQTAVRTRYPLLHRRIAWVSLASMFESAAFLGPLALLIILPFWGWTVVGEAIAAAASLIWLIIYSVILKQHFRSGWLASINFFAAALSDILLMNYSLFKYEFGSVLWKGREVAVKIVNPEPKPANDLGRERRP